MEVDNLLADAEKLTGGKVTVEGVCTHICRHGGRKIFLMGTDDTQVIRIEAGEKIGSFKPECVNNVVRVTGTLVFDQRARHTDEVVHAFGLEGADLFARFDPDDLCVVGTHQEYFAAPVAADMRAYALHGDLFPGQLFRVGEQVVHLERRCGLCRFRRLFPVVRIAAASCGHERRRGDYQIYD